MSSREIRFHIELDMPSAAFRDTPKDSLWLITISGDIDGSSSALLVFLDICYANLL